MKLIIVIPEHDKNVIERFVRGDGCEDFPPSIIENLIRAVYFGTPLEKHDAEVIKETVASIWGKPCADAVSRQDLLQGLCDDVFSYTDDQHEVIDFIEKMPPVNPQNDVLDEIRADIEQVAEEEIKHDKTWATGLKYALKIIDKYKTESEE